MKIVIAPDSFKESLSAKHVAQCIEDGFKHHFPDAEYIQLPLADGGEGTVEVLMQGLGGAWQTSQLTGPYGEKVDAKWALLDQGKTALIEIASASGLDLTTVQQRNPLLATSYGTGELIKIALDRGVDKILLGLGGSATNDGGAGIAQALGAKLLDRNGCPLNNTAQALTELAYIDLQSIHPRCQEVEFIIACDVNNPLLGETGASAVFGPQKGATSTQVQQLEQALTHFAHLSHPLTNIDYAIQTGYGAAGGAPLGLSLLFDLNLQPGIEMVLDTLNVDAILENADLVITGEGQMDNQTLQGKAPYGIAKRAKHFSIPVIGIAGSLGKETNALHPTIDAVFDSVRAPQNLSQVLQEARANLYCTAYNVAATLAIGRKLSKNT